jgi:hypothetical protein
MVAKEQRLRIREREQKSRAEAMGKEEGSNGVEERKDKRAREGRKVGEKPGHREKQKSKSANSAVMRFLYSSSSAKTIREWTRENLKLGLNRAMPEQLNLFALQKIHALGDAHLNIKFDKIFLTERSPPLTWLADFGIAQRRRKPWTHKAATFHYRASELVSGFTFPPFFQHVEVRTSRGPRVFVARCRFSSRMFTSKPTETTLGE